jgi:hypothetical protein
LEPIADELSASLQDIFSVDHTVSGRAKRTGSSTHRLLTPANIARCGGLPPPAHSARYFGSRSTLRLMVLLLVVHDFNVADQIADDFYRD